MDLFSRKKVLPWIEAWLRYIYTWIVPLLNWALTPSLLVVHFIFIATTVMADADLAQENLGPAVLITAWVMPALALTVVLARYYTRLKITRKITVDDGLIVLTFVSLSY